MKIPIKLKKKHRYILISGKKEDVEKLLEIYRKLFGEIIYKISIMNVIEHKGFYIIKIYKKYVNHFFISLLYFKVKNFGKVYILRVGGTIKSIFKKEKILK